MSVLLRDLNPNVTNVINFSYMGGWGFERLGFERANEKRYKRSGKLARE